MLVFCIRLFGEVILLGAVGVHPVDLGVAFPVGVEGDLLAVQRVPWPLIGTRVAGEIGLARAISVHRVDLRVAVTLGLESDLHVVWRPVGGSFKRQSGGEEERSEFIRVRTSCGLAYFC
jgi:hypothetical protein